MKWMMFASALVFALGCEESSLPQLPPVEPLIAEEAAPRVPAAEALTSRSNAPQTHSQNESPEMAEYRRLAPLIAEIQSDLHNELKGVGTAERARMLKGQAERDIAELFEGSELTVQRYSEISLRMRSVTMNRHWKTRSN